MRARVVAIVLAGVLVALVIIFNGSGRSPSPAATIRFSTEIVLTPPMKIALGLAIRSAGFNCPVATLAYAEGNDAFGATSKIWCGPTDQEGTYENAVFRVTIRPDKTMMIEPWWE